MSDLDLVAVSGETYKMFAKRYKIALSYRIANPNYMRYEKKTLAQLKNEIYQYEKQNNIVNGLYF